MPFVPPRLILGGRAAYAYLDDVSLVISNVPSWTDADVDRYMREMTVLAGRVTASGSITHFLGETFGPHHRNYVVKWLEREGLRADTRVCMLSDSTVLRGAITAYGWLTRAEVAAYSPHDLEAGARWLARGLVAKPEDIARSYRECRALLASSPSVANP